MEMNEERKNVVCDFKDLPDNPKKYFLDALECKEISVFYESVQKNCNIDLICSFSCLDNYIRCLTGQKSLYISKPEIKGIMVEALLNDEDCIWCTGYGRYANSLIKLDKSSMNAKIFPMPYETIQTDRLFLNILKVENNIYLVPGNSKYIAIYNITDGMWKKIDIEDESIDGWYYSAAVEVEGSVYFFPNKARNIIKINCNNYEKEIIPIKLSNEIKQYNACEEFSGAGAILSIDKDIYFYSRMYNSFLKFNTEKKCIELEKQLQNKDFSRACVVDEKIFWMFTMSGENKIVKYDIGKKEIAYYDKIPSIEYNRVPFYKGIKFGNKIVFAPGLAEKAIIFDTVTSEMKVFEELNIETYEKSKENWIYSCIDTDAENIYLFENIINKFIKYNIKSNSVEKYELHVSEKEWYEGQAQKVKQIVLQGIEASKPSNNDITEEY